MYLIKKYNFKSPSIKRIMKEAYELREPTEDYFAQPLEENIFEWHFTIRGPSDSCFSKGIYHGKIILPTDYPMKPPNIIILTPNGRFQVNNKICLSVSGHHPETWQPSWSIRTVLLALIGYMITNGDGAIGSLDYTESERINLAIKSRSWSCPTCGNIKNILLERKLCNNLSKDEKLDIDKKEKELAKLICFKNEVQQNLNAENNDQILSQNLHNDCNLQFNLRCREPITNNNSNQTMNSDKVDNKSLKPNTSNSILTSTYFILIILIMIILLILRRLFFV